MIWSMSPIPAHERPIRSSNEPFTIGFIGRIVPEKGLSKSGAINFCLRGIGVS